MHSSIWDTACSWGVSEPRLGRELGCGGKHTDLASGTVRGCIQSIESGPLLAVDHEMGSCRSGWIQEACHETVERLG